MQGYVLKIGPKPLKGFKYNHPFDGHGYINRFAIYDNKIIHDGFHIQTKHMLHEKNANMKLYNGLGTTVDKFNLNVNNFCNISMIEYENMMHCFGETGFPYEVDPLTKVTLGYSDLWNTPEYIKNLPYVPISPHPIVEDGNVYNFSSLGWGLSIFSNNESHLIVHPPGNLYYSHDFCLTENYWVFYLNKMSVELLKHETLIESIKFEPGHKILLVNRLSKEKTYYDIPSIYDNPVLHVPKAIENENGIEIFMCMCKDMDSIPTDVSVSDLSNCILHKACIKNKNLSIDVISEIPGDMPVVYDNNILLTNSNRITKYSYIDDTIRTKSYDNVTFEEPVYGNNKIYALGHTEKSSIMHVLDKDNLECIDKFEFPKLNFGFHGAYFSTIPTQEPETYRKER